MYFVSMLFLYVYIYKIIIRPDVILVVTLYVLGTIFQRTEFIYIYKLISACSMVRENVFTGSRIGWNLAQELRGGVRISCQISGKIRACLFASWCRGV